MGLWLRLFSLPVLLAILAALCWYQGWLAPLSQPWILLALVAVCIPWMAWQSHAYIHSWLALTHKDSLPTLVQRHLQLEEKDRALSQLKVQAEEGWLKLDKDFCIEALDGQAARLLAVKPEEVMGRNLISLDSLRWPYAELKSWQASGASQGQWQAGGLDLFGFQLRGHYWLLLRADSRLQKENRRLRQYIRRDPLTGLYNRQRFVQLLTRRCEEKPLGLLVQLNVHHFRLFNDTIGFAAGDVLLQTLGKTLQEALHHGELAARGGGDVFWLLLDKADNWQARLEELLTRLGELPCLWQDSAIRLDLIAGVAELEPELDPWELLRRADVACHHASETELAWQRYQEDLPGIDNRQQASQWAQKVSRALAVDDFLLFYQPLMSLKHPMGPFKAEVLVRMVADDGTLVSPGRFLAAAERFKLMKQLDRWVLKSVIDWLGQHRDCWDRLILAVNLSGESMTDPLLARQISQWLLEAGVPGRCLCVEITESVAIDSLPRARRFMASLQKLGIRFALDDFGTGFSSFRYLQNLPVDYVKIDGSLIRDLAGNQRDRAMVQALATVCHSLSLPVVAEFVDDERLLPILRELGVDFAQGNLIGRPSRLDLLPQELNPAQQQA
ncbi:bifunctional diguanylate cyclase/phosphodiesterase [Gallaecimonas sp. GXIMD4217]|uniref:putative bifunctional diguanylate cyclase/phosphodiesterase n=1 Tax=Gallaecimonas sp. GXIMD4217 TaxID=3131927 RepID=UPI00311AF39A